MWSSVLRNSRAVAENIEIMRVFVAPANRLPALRHVATVPSRAQPDLDDRRLRQLGLRLSLPRLNVQRQRRRRPGDRRLSGAAVPDALVNNVVTINTRRVVKYGA